MKKTKMPKLSYFGCFRLKEGIFIGDKHAAEVI